jgi:sugar/nucleoside kinase (ribokinase family)
MLPGGGCANTCRQLAALGRHGTPEMSVRLFSTIGNDALGSWLFTFLEKEGLALIDNGSVKEKQGTVQASCIVLSGASDRAFVSSRGCISKFSSDDLDSRLIETMDHIHVGGYFNCDGLQNGGLHRILQKVRASGGTTSLDPQFDARGNWTGVDGDLLRILPLLDDFLPSEDEARAIAEAAGLTSSESRADSLEPTLAALVELCNSGDRAGSLNASSDSVPPAGTAQPTGRGGLSCRRAPTIIVVKRGSRGAVAAAGADRWFCPAPQGVVFLDAVGAGDAFAAGFLREALAHLVVSEDRKDACAVVDDALRAGCILGAMAVEREGACAVPFTRDEVESWKTSCGRMDKSSGSSRARSEG